MKKIILSLSLGLLGTLTYAQGLDSIIVEKYYISNAADAVGTYTITPGSVTYRVYADLAAGYEFQAMYGELVSGSSTPLHTLLINTTTSFFNNEDRGATTSNAIPSAQLKNNTVALDSWFSVGAAATGQMGVLKSEDNGVANLTLIHSPSGVLTNTVAAMGIPLTTQDGIVAGTPEAVTFVGLTTELDVFDATNQFGNSFSTSNGSIASLNGAVGPTANNRVLIGQFTTDGTFHFELNIQIGLATGGGVEKWVASNPQAGELTMSSLTYTSTSVVSIPNVLPTVSITAPATAATYTTGATVTMVATAADTDGTIDSVEFFVDGVKIGKDISSPYSFTLTSTVGTHTLTAVATDNDGGQTTSATKTIIVSDPVIGINDSEASSGSIAIYPNPTSDFVIIEINVLKQTDLAYSIYDLKGNSLLNNLAGVVDGQFKERIDLSSLIAGQYIIEISLDGVIYAKKLIKN